MTIAETLRRERSPGGKLGVAMLIAALLAIPLFSIYHSLFPAIPSITYNFRF